MKPLAQCRRLAGKHWREFHPQLAAESETPGSLCELSPKPVQKRKCQVVIVRRRLLQQGLTPQQTRDRAQGIARRR